MLQPPTPPPITTAPALLFTGQGTDARILRRGPPWRRAVSDEHVTIDDILPRVEQLAGDDRVVTELPGGLTNTNYKVEVGGRSYVVRVSSKDAGLLAIDRDERVPELAGRGRRPASAPVSSPTCPSSARSCSTSSRARR